MDLNSAVPAIMSALATAAVGLVVRAADKRKYNAEIEKIHAETRKTEAEADDLASVRIIRELDRLAQINDEQARLNARQGETIQAQREEIAALRARVEDYAVREQTHATENASLRQRIHELEQPGTGIDPVKLIRDAMPLEIPHQKNEFDGPTHKDR